MCPSINDWSVWKWSYLKLFPSLQSTPINLSFIRYSAFFWRLFRLWTKVEFTWSIKTHDHLYNFQYSPSGGNIKTKSECSNDHKVDKYDTILSNGFDLRPSNLFDYNSLVLKIKPPNKSINQTASFTYTIILRRNLLKIFFNQSI